MGMNLWYIFVLDFFYIPNLQVPSSSPDVCTKGFGSLSCTSLSLVELSRIGREIALNVAISLQKNPEDYDTNF